MPGGLRRFLPFASGAPVGVARPFAPSREERSERAGRLAADHPGSAAALDFYRELLELQEPLSENRKLPRWLDDVAVTAGEVGPGGDAAPALRLGRLSVKRLRRPFGGFLEGLVPVANPVLAPLAEELAGDGELAARTLGAFLAGEGLERPAGELGCTPFQLEFFPRAFVQPVAEGLAALAFEEGLMDGLSAEEPGGPEPAAGEGGGGGATRGGGRDGGEDGAPPARTECPVCGHLPVAARLADEENVENRRRLVCSLCATAWAFPRLTCPACGETEAERLGHHVAESWPHLRVEECESCSSYLKTTDLREDGNAVPVVEDLASIELDVWADDQELNKIRRNLLGI